MTGREKTGGGGETYGKWGAGVQNRFWGGFFTVIFEIITFLSQEHFKTVTVTITANLGKLFQMTLKDGNWNQWK